MFLFFWGFLLLTLFSLLKNYNQTIYFCCINSILNEVIDIELINESFKINSWRLTINLSKFKSQIHYFLFYCAWKNYDYQSTFITIYYLFLGFELISNAIIYQIPIIRLVLIRAPVPCNGTLSMFCYYSIISFIIYAFIFLYYIAGILDVACYTATCYYYCIFYCYCKFYCYYASHFYYFILGYEIIAYNSPVGIRNWAICGCVKCLNFWIHSCFCQLNSQLPVLQALPPKPNRITCQVNSVRRNLFIRHSEL